MSEVLSLGGFHAASASPVQEGKLLLSAIPAPVQIPVQPSELPLGAQHSLLSTWYRSKHTSDSSLL